MVWVWNREEEGDDGRDSDDSGIVSDSVVVPDLGDEELDHDWVHEAG